MNPDMLHPDRTVPRIEYPEPTRANPDDVARELDERERASLAERTADAEKLSIAHIAILLGQPVHFAGRYGVFGVMLIEEAGVGNLRTLAPLNRQPSGGDWVKRNNAATTPIDREAFREWLLRFGTDRDRKSLAGKWAGISTEE